MNRLREAIIGLGVIYAVALGFYYRWLLDELAQGAASGTLASVMHSAMLQSIGVYVVTFITSLTLVIAGTPPPDEGGA